MIQRSNNGGSRGEYSIGFHVTDHFCHSLAIKHASLVETSVGAPWFLVSISKVQIQSSSFELSESTDHTVIRCRRRQNTWDSFQVVHDRGALNIYLDLLFRSHVWLLIAFTIILFLCCNHFIFVFCNWCPGNYRYMWKNLYLPCFFRSIPSFYFQTYSLFRSDLKVTPSSKLGHRSYASIDSFFRAFCQMLASFWRERCSLMSYMLSFLHAHVIHQSLNSLDSEKRPNYWDYSRLFCYYAVCRRLRWGFLQVIVLISF